jgi:EAL and modified HD-GYP domain-containing signal transduction protein
MSDKYLLGRQPIMDKEEKIFAYELLFRSEQSLQQAHVVDGSLSTASVIINTLSGIGAHEVLGDRKGVINIEFDLLMNDALAILPCEKIILELHQNLPVTGEILERCRKLKESGFILALDNQTFLTEKIELYKVVDLIGIDLRQTPVDQLRSVIGHYRQFPAQLLAQKVETRIEFNECQALGFDYFQGFFFAKPTVIQKNKINETTGSLLRIVHQIINDADIDVIVRIIQESPGLTYKLLLLANSVTVGARRVIDSVRHAVSLLGRDQIRRWAQLELFASGNSQELDSPLVDMASVRASFMEYLTKCHPMLRGFRDAADRAFLTGTLSMLESIYNIHIEDIVKSVELSEDVKIALLRRAGLFGEMLTFVESLEQLDFEKSQVLLAKMKIPHEQMLDAQRKSFLWKTGGVNAADSSTS